MKNPWSKIKESSCMVLDEDKENIDFEDKNFNFQYFPEPFIWDKNADIYILLANPWRISNDEKEKLYSKENIYIYLNNLNHKVTKWVNPFFYLDEKLWWNWWYHTLFKYLIEVEEISKEIIWKNFFTLELYWYHSHNFDSKLINKLNSVRYTKFLLEKAIKENKIILLWRSRKNWFNLCPELEKYNNCHFIAINRSMEIRNTTLSPWIYKKIIKMLK